MFVCTFEIENGQQTQDQTIQAPRIMLEQQFLSYVQQAANASHPARIKMSRKVPVYDSFCNKWIERENSIEFMNKAYESQKGGNNG